MTDLTRQDRDFTLIELLIVVAILGILAAVVVPNVGRFLGRGEGEARDTEFQNLITAVSAMMVDNDIASLPNPSALTTGNGTGGCDTGTTLMTAFPDLLSAVASADKLTDPNGGTYLAGVDPLGDKDGYILFGHDLVAGDDQVFLVNYMTVSSSSMCYQTTADGTITQFDTAGTQTNP